MVVVVKIARWQLGFSSGGSRWEIFLEKVPDMVEHKPVTSSPTKAPQVATRTRYQGVVLDSVPVPPGESSEDYRDWLHWEADLRDRGVDGDPDFDEVMHQCL